MQFNQGDTVIRVAQGNLPSTVFNRVKGKEYKVSIFDKRYNIGGSMYSVKYAHEIYKLKPAIELERIYQ